MWGWAANNCQEGIHKQTEKQEMLLASGIAVKLFFKKRGLRGHKERHDNEHAKQEEHNAEDKLLGKRTETVCKRKNRNQKKDDLPVSVRVFYSPFHRY